MWESSRAGISTGTVFLLSAMALAAQAPGDNRGPGSELIRQGVQLDLQGKGVDARTPKDWFGIATFPNVEPSRFGWAILHDDGMPPGGKAGPFSFASNLLPGLVTAYIQSTQIDEPLQTDSLSPEDEQKVLEALTLENNSVQLIVVGPKFQRLDQEGLIAKISREFQYAAKLPQFASVSAGLTRMADALSDGHMDEVRGNLLNLVGNSEIQSSFITAMVTDLNFALGTK